MREGGLHLGENLFHIFSERAAVGLSHGVHLLSHACVKGLGHLLGLTDAAALNNDVVELGELRQADELLEEITSQGAADTAILESDDFLIIISLLQAVCLLDERGINVDPGGRGTCQ